MDDRTPILIGAGQLTQRDVDPAEALEPVALMRASALLAAEDAGLDGRRRSRALDSVSVVNVLSWPYANPPRLLAEQLGARPRGGDLHDGRRQLAADAGQRRPRRGSPTASVRARAARRRGGDARAGARAPRRRAPRLVVGRRRIRRASSATRAPARATTRCGTASSCRCRSTRCSRTRCARAAAARPSSTCAPLGALYARLSQVAAANPYAWFRSARSAAEIATVDARNRIIAFPVPEADERDHRRRPGRGGADDLGRHGAHARRAARPLGVPAGLRRRARPVVRLRAPRLRELARRSPRPATQALAMAGVEHRRDRPVRSLQLLSERGAARACDALGIADDDPRPLTVTGGLAAFGGPGNNYSMHAIATMLQRLRARARAARAGDGARLVRDQARGRHLRHRARTDAVAKAPPLRHSTRLDAMPHPALAERPDGAATIETYTVMHDRGGAPSVAW